MSKSNGVPSLKKRFVGLIRNLSQPVCTSDQANDNSKLNARPDTFIHKYLQGEGRSAQPTIIYGRSVEELPPRPLVRLRPKSLAAFTGPKGGLTAVNKTHPVLDTSEPDVDYIDAEDALPDDQPNAYVTGQRPPPPPDPDLKRSESEEISGILNWNRPHEAAFGLSTTLYERHPVTHERAGNPIADAFGIVARENNAILALADGVNWGEEASLAAKCAIHGCLSYINTALFSPGVAPPKTTTDLFVALLRSFHSAHSLILQEHGMLTTLTVAIVAPMLNSETHVVCVANVGDSLAFVYSQKHGVREVTQGSHDIYSMRDMRDALGALGPVDGLNPELNNLTCSMTFCEHGDIVFITSDGISDNFDPVVGKFVLPKSDGKENKNQGHRTAKARAGYHRTVSEGESTNPAHGRAHPNSRQNRHNPNQGSRGSQHQRKPNTVPAPEFKQPVTRSKSHSAVTETELLRHDPHLPIVEAHQRHELTLLRMDDLLRSGLTSNCPVTTAQALCLEMVHFATKLTVAKRRILEDPDLYPPAGAPQDLSRNDQRNRRKKVCEKLALVPGKLDHATVVAYTVGHFDSVDDETEDIVPVTEDPAATKRPTTAAVGKSPGNAGGAPLASPDSARSIASQFEEARYAYLRGDPIPGDDLRSYRPDSQRTDRRGQGRAGRNPQREQDKRGEGRTPQRDQKEGASNAASAPSRGSSNNNEKENKNPNYAAAYVESVI